VGRPFAAALKGHVINPVRSYRNSGTGFIRRIGVASLCRAAEHINHSGRCVSLASAFLAWQPSSIAYPWGSCTWAGRRFCFRFPVYKPTHSFLGLERSYCRRQLFGDRRVFGHMFRSGEARSPNSWIFRPISHVLTFLKLSHSILYLSIRYHPQLEIWTETPQFGRSRWSVKRQQRP